MKLFYISPMDPEKLKWWFIAEVILSIVNYLLVSALAVTFSKLRLHPHFKIFLLYYIGNFYPFITSRLIILAYQSGIFDTGEPESNPIIVTCSWIRGFYYALMMTLSLPVSMEREISLFYIQQYEYRFKFWVPFSTIFLSVLMSSLAVTFVTFEYCPIIIIAFLLAFIQGIGALVYLYNYRKTWILNNALKKRKPCYLKYSLSIRYQLEENLWFAETIKNVTVTIAFVLAWTFAAFILANLPIFPMETMEILDCFLNVLMAANAPLITLMTFLYNKYMTGILKGWLFGAEVEPEIDEGDSYFDQLLEQWGEPQVEKTSTQKRTLFMKLLLLRE